MYNGQSLPYSTSSRGATYNSSTSYKPIYGPGGSINSISDGVTEAVTEPGFFVVIAAANAFYGEGSGPRKGAHIDHLVLENPANMPKPLPQFQVGVKAGKKGQKRVGKKTEPQPLVGMINESNRTYDRPISMRQMLK